MDGCRIRHIHALCQPVASGLDEARAKKERPHPVRDEAFQENLATTYSTDVKSVPSALWGLTSLFGMERGVAPTL